MDRTLTVERIVESGILVGARRFEEMELVELNHAGFARFKESSSSNRIC